MAGKAWFLSGMRMPLGTQANAPAGMPAPAGGPARINRRRRLTGAQLKELKEAWFEYEMAQGDWSKSR